MFGAQFGRKGGDPIFFSVVFFKNMSVLFFTQFLRKKCGWFIFYIFS